MRIAQRFYRWVDLRTRTGRPVGTIENEPPQQRFGRPYTVIAVFCVCLRAFYAAGLSCDSVALRAANSAAIASVPDLVRR